MAQSVLARTDAAGNQVVDVTVHDGYEPESIIARADAPLRLVFRRTDDEPCLDRIVFSSPRLDRRLAPLAITTIVLPPQAPGEVRFTCAMGRYRGQIELVAERSPAVADRRGARPSRIGSPLVIGILSWLCTVPIVGIGSLLILGPGGALLVTVLALPAWVIWSASRYGRRLGSPSP